jgi:hypothetical protein
MAFDRINHHQLEVEKWEMEKVSEGRILQKLRAKTARITVKIASEPAIWIGSTSDPNDLGSKQSLNRNQLSFTLDIGLRSQSPRPVQ